MAGPPPLRRWGRTVRWSERRAVVRGGAATSEAQAFVAEVAASGASIAIPLATVGCLLAISVFVPPVLLLNLPLLLLRAALGWWWGAAPRVVFVAPFSCPVCGVACHPGVCDGELPLALGCAGCAATLTVDRAPRINLVAG